MQVVNNLNRKIENPYNLKPSATFPTEAKEVSDPELEKARAVVSSWVCGAYWFGIKVL